MLVFPGQQQKSKVLCIQRILGLAIKKCGIQLTSWCQPKRTMHFFVMTNMMITNDQSPSECAESLTVPEANCMQDSDCLPIHKQFPSGHGVTTGVCNATTKTCMVKAWCPIEKEKLSTKYPVLNATKTFTVLIKNHVYFPLYKKSVSNIIESSNTSYLQHCNYDANSDPFCPVFQLGYIVDHAQHHMEHKQTYDEIAYKGELIEVNLKIILLFLCI
ncbi:P2RX4 [Bugula neritina]|uniref:P2RX4 n=1 Tax=Bugula neritina TaxID=10212 RepID=A0A7J7K8Z0_BUGNE|nr:P2RX4 [Bugula neritina]